MFVTFHISLQKMSKLLGCKNICFFFFVCPLAAAQTSRHDVLSTKKVTMVKNDASLPRPFTSEQLFGLK